MVRRTYIIVVLAIAALFANTECYALCLSSACQTASNKKVAGCHHSAPAKDKKTECNHRASDLTSVEASNNLVKISVAQFSVHSPVTDYLAPGLDWSARRTSLWPERGSPPGTPLFLSLSTLRI